MAPLSLFSHLEEGAGMDSCAHLELGMPRWSLDRITLPYRCELSLHPGEGNVSIDS